MNERDYTSEKLEAVAQMKPLPCPLCGGKAYAVWPVNGTQMFKVGCAPCGIELKAAWYRDEDKPTKDILSLWNSRAAAHPETPISAAPDSIVGKVRLLVERFRALGAVPELCDLPWKLCIENERLRASVPSGVRKDQVTIKNCPNCGGEHWGSNKCPYLPEEMARTNAILAEAGKHPKVATDTPQHASAPVGHRCADCQIVGEACPLCYAAWWKRRHPNVIQLPGSVPPESTLLEKLPRHGPHFDAARPGIFLGMQQESLGVWVKFEDVRAALASQARGAAGSAEGTKA